MVDYAVDVCGIDHVGIGTDIGEGGTVEDIRWMREGRWTRRPGVGASGTLPSSGGEPEDAWFRTNADFPLIAEGLARRGFSPADVDAVMGGNWLRFYRKVFGGTEVNAAEDGPAQPGAAAS